jgi:hypothetical protein
MKTGMEYRGEYKCRNFIFYFRNEKRLFQPALNGKHKKNKAARMYIILYKHFAVFEMDARFPKTTGILSDFFIFG